MRLDCSGRGLADEAGHQYPSLTNVHREMPALVAQESRQGAIHPHASLPGPDFVSRARVRWSHPRNLAESLPGGGQSITGEAEPEQTYLLMSPGLIGEGLGSTPFFFPSNLFPEPEKA